MLVDSSDDVGSAHVGACGGDGDDGGDDIGVAAGGVGSGGGAGGRELTVVYANIDTHREPAQGRAREIMVSPTQPRTQLRQRVCAWCGASSLHRHPPLIRICVARQRAC